MFHYPFPAKEHKIKIIHELQSFECTLNELLKWSWTTCSGVFKFSRYTLKHITSLGNEKWNVHSELIRYKKSLEHIVGGQAMVGYFLF